MKVRYLRVKQWFLVTLIGVLGLSSCRSHKETIVSDSMPKEPPMQRDEILLMYGTPSMDFRLRGEVKDEQGRPVQDIRVNMLEYNMEVEGTTLQGDPDRVKEWLEESAVITDEKGRFVLDRHDFPRDRVRLMVRDVDGAANGDLQDKVVDVEVRTADVDTTGANGWYRGTFNKRIYISLDRKK